VVVPGRRKRGWYIRYAGITNVSIIDHGRINVTSSIQLNQFPSRPSTAGINNTRNRPYRVIV
jgi:hypothetical protein